MIVDSDCETKKWPDSSTLEVTFQNFLHEHSATPPNIYRHEDHPNAPQGENEQDGT